MARKTYTPAELRQLSKDRGPFFADNSRAALAWCADVIEAANAMANENAKLAAAAKAATVILAHIDEGVTPDAVAVEKLRAAIAALGAK